MFDKSLANPAAFRNRSLMFGAPLSDAPGIFRCFSIQPAMTINCFREKSETLTTHSDIYRGTYNGTLDVPCFGSPNSFIGGVKY